MRKLALLLLLLPACDDGDGADPPAADAGAHASLNLEVVTPPPESAPAGTEVAATLRLSTPGGPAAGLSLEALVEAGGGSATISGPTDEAGEAEVAWTLGPAPIANALRISVGPGAAATLEVLASAPDPAPESPYFGDVAGWLEAEERRGTTEDLAFTDDGLVVGVPGGLVVLDAEGGITPMELTGDPIERPLGIALDRDGALWVIDAGPATLLRVSPEGEVSTVLVDDGEAPLEGPNYVAVGPDGGVYVTDPCRGLLLRYDPIAGEVDARHTFDLATEGGPNGLAFRGDTLWTVTENTVLLCGHAGVAPIDAPLAGVYRLPVTAEGFGERTAVATEAGVFGDGLAFDAAGNLYVILDQVANLMLAESAIWVLPEGGSTLERFAVAAPETIYANLAFGRGAFGATSIYIALLSVPPFAGPASRGVQRVEAGVEGLPLLP